MEGLAVLTLIVASVFGQIASFVLCWNMANRAGDDAIGEGEPE